MKWLDIAFTMLAAFLSPEAVVTDDARVVWSGQLSARGGALELRIAQGAASLHGAEVELALGELAVSEFGAAACGSSEAGALLVSGMRGQSVVALWIEQADAQAPTVLREQSLPAAPIGRPAAYLSRGACAFALPLTDGSLWRVDAEHSTHVSDFANAPRDAAELPLGALVTTTASGVVVAAVDRALVAHDAESGALERYELVAPLVPPAVASADGASIWVLNARGELLAYAPFQHAPTAMTDATYVTPSGLAVWSDGTLGSGGLVWCGRDGRLIGYDGTAVRELARWSSSTRWPVLVFDVLDEGRPQLVAALDDGSLGVVASSVDHNALRDERFFVAARASAPPRLTDRVDTQPGLLRVPAGVTDAVIGLGQLHAAPLLRDGASIQTGEALSGGMSGPLSTRLSPVWPAARAHDAAGEPATAAHDELRSAVTSDKVALPSALRTQATGTDAAASQQQEPEQTAVGCTCRAVEAGTRPSAGAWLIASALLLWRLRRSRGQRMPCRSSLR